jgi:translation elongation factor EF-Tu-like GTPase
MPGENLTIQVTFINKSVINEGLRFIMREGKLTIGAGLVTQLIE